MLQATLQREGLQHLHCFRQLPQQLLVAGEAVQQLMTSDLLGLMRFQALPHLQDHMLAAIMQHQELLASGWVSLPPYTTVTSWPVPLVAVYPTCAKAGTFLASLNTKEFCPSEGDAKW